MINVIAIGGEPGTGKSTLIRRVITDLVNNTVVPPSNFQYALLRGHIIQSPGVRFGLDGQGRATADPASGRLWSTCLLGRYDNPREKYPGTDKLSMAVHEDTERFIGTVARNNFGTGVDISILFEGDRLFCKRILVECERLQGIGMLKLHAMRLVVPESVLVSRRLARNDTKPEGFLRGRKTKLDNLCETFPCIVNVDNESEQNLNVNTLTITDLIRGDNVTRAKTNNKRAKDK